MKQLSEEEIKKIAYNCRKSTFLIEKQQISTISSREKMELKMHLAGCSICITYMQQSRLITQMASKLLRVAPTKLKLDQEFKMRLQTRISNQLGNN